MSLERIEQGRQNAPQINPLDLIAQVAEDLESYLSRFPNKNLGLKVIAQETGLHSKTLKRLLQKQNRPTYQTLIKLYTLFLDCQDYSELLKKCPESVSLIIQENCPHETLELKPKNKDLSVILKESPIASEFVVLAGLRPLSRNSISFRYGSFGLKTFQELIEKGILQQIDTDQYTLNSAYSDFDAETMRLVGQYFLKMFCRTQEGQTEGQNLLGLFTESLNEQGIQEWLKLDTQCFHQKTKIAKQPQYRGHIPTYTLQATDRLLTE